MSKTVSGAEIVIDCLVSAEVENVFGIPGNSVLKLFDELGKNKDRIKLFSFCHEEGACFAADGFARASGKLGVVFATSGAGATNLVTGIANSFLDSTPLLVITGNVPLSNLGSDAFQEVDIYGVTSPVTKHSVIVTDVRHIEREIKSAIAIAQSGRKGPVLVDIPKDVLETEIPLKEYAVGCSTDNIYGIKQYEDGSAKLKLSKTAELIAASQKPLLLIGGGVKASDCGELAVELSKKAGIPLVSTFMGISSALDSDNADYFGLCGIFGTPCANFAVRHCDLVVAVGSRFSDRITSVFGKNNKTIVHIDIDPSEIDKNVHSSMSIVCDAKTALETLCSFDYPNPENGFADEIHTHINDPDGDRFESKAVKCLSILSNFTNENTFVTTDVGLHQTLAAKYLRFKRRNSLLTSGGLGAMGYGLPSAIGASIASGKMTVAVCGDGSLLMNLSELLTAKRYNIPCVVAVFNNKGYKIIRNMQKKYCEGRIFGSMSDEYVDFASIAKGMGIPSFRVRNVAKAADIFAKAFAAAENNTVLVDVRLN